MDDEDISSNLFFQYLQKSNVLEQAVKKSYIIAIPPTKSLPNPSSSAFSRDFSLSHVLIRSTQRPNVYHTLSARTLLFKENSPHNELITVSTRSTSWPEQRVIKILSEETYYTENFESFTILHLSLPLYGPVSPHYLALIKAQTLCESPPIERQFNDHVTVLLHALGDECLTLLTTQTQLFLATLKGGYILLRDYEQSLCTKIHTFCYTLLCQILTSISHHNTSLPLETPTSSNADEIEQLMQNMRINHQIDIKHINKQSDPQYPLSLKNWGEIIIAIDFIIMTKLSYYISHRILELYHVENNLLYNAALWAQSLLAIPVVPQAAVPNPNTKTVFTFNQPNYNYEDSSDYPTITYQPNSIPTYDQIADLSTASLSSTPLTSSPYPSFYIQPLEEETQPPQPLSPSNSSNTDFLSPQSTVLQQNPPIHPNSVIFDRIGLRPELAVVDFTSAALALHRALSLQEFIDVDLRCAVNINKNTKKIDDSVPVNNRYCCSTMLLSELVDVISLAQRCVSFHYEENTQNIAQTQESLNSQMTQLYRVNSLPPTVFSPNASVQPQPSKEDLSITAEDLLALFQYFIILAPSYTMFSNCVYINNFAPVGENNGMGYETNLIGLPADPAQLVLPTSKMHSIIVSLRGAIDNLMNLFQQYCPHYYTMLKSVNVGPGGASAGGALIIPSNNATIVKVNTHTLKSVTHNHHYQSAGLSIFSGDIHHLQSNHDDNHLHHTNLHTPAQSYTGTISQPPSSKTAIHNIVDNNIIRQIQEEKEKADRALAIKQNAYNLQKKRNIDDDDFLTDLLGNDSSDDF